MSNKIREGIQRPDLPEPSDLAADPLLDVLTPRESEVLRLLARGFGIADIAETLSISPSTARNHIQRILEKFGVHSRLEALAHAYQKGLIDPSGDPPTPSSPGQ